MSRARHKTDRKREQWAADERAARDAKRGAGTRAAVASIAALSPERADASDPVESRIAQARRALRKGELRRASVLVREACSLDETRARSWTLLGSLLSRVGRPDEARTAYKQALWLRSRSGEAQRARVTRSLLEGLEPCAA